MFCLKDFNWWWRNFTLNYRLIRVNFYFYFFFFLFGYSIWGGERKEVSITLIPLLAFVVFMYFSISQHLLFNMCYYLLVLIWFDPVEEIFVAGVRSSSIALLWFFAVCFLQQPFHNDHCLYRLGFFIESFCRLLSSCVALKNFRVTNETLVPTNRKIIIMRWLATPFLP